MELVRRLLSDMVFSSIEFLFFFLPVVLAVYFLTPRRWRNLILLIASLLFYTWDGGLAVLFLLGSILANYVFGWYGSVARQRENPRAKALAICASVTANLALLGWFKYAGFFAAQFGATVSVALPIGISFYTFQSISYTIDIVRGRCNRLANPVDFAMYITLFPHLIAGPIVRYHEIAPEITHRESRWDDVAEGALRFGHGLVKKVVIADSIALVADSAFALDSGRLTFAAAWIGVLAYSMQIYFDFSGYADMAIGLARILGFKFPENFDRPYSAYSITDFWRRWHLTLSNWFRDYVYLPLGGSHRSSARTYGNLSAVFLVTGLWHGAAWTFVLWGIYHGALMLTERATETRWLDSAPRPVWARLRTFVLVVVGWVLFRSPDIGTAIDYYGSMLSPFRRDAFDLAALDLRRESATILMLSLAVVALPRDFRMGQLLAHSRSWRADLARAVVMCVAVPYAAVVISASTFTPFLYFRF